MKSHEFIIEKIKRLEEGWSQKYKSSINCSHPKGFSQRAHCAGKKKHNESVEMEMVCEDCGMCETHGDHSKDKLDELKCWSGYHRVAGTKAGFPGSCAKNKTNEDGVAEGLNEMDKTQTPPGRDGDIDWTKKQIHLGPEHTMKAKDVAKHALKILNKTMKKSHADTPKKKGVAEGLTESVYSLEQAHAIFDDFEQAMADRGLTEDIFDFFTDEEIILETAAWRRSAGKSKKGGLNAKGVASYRRENPGSKLQMAVTTKPSKLKPGSKAAKRRKSFCARMGGVKGPMKKPNGKPTRKALALRKWNC